MNLDETDQQILYLLQSESRANLTHDEIAARTDVSSTTVGNRIASLHEAGILLGYLPQIDYEAAGAPHHILFVCTAPISEREAHGTAAIDVHRVVNVRELLTGTRNLHVEAVCLDLAAVEGVANELDTLGLDVVDSKIFRRDHAQPFSDFGAELVDHADESDAA